MEIVSALTVPLLCIILTNLFYFFWTVRLIKNVEIPDFSFNNMLFSHNDKRTVYNLLSSSLTNAKFKVMHLRTLLWRLTIILLYKS